MVQVCADVNCTEKVERTKDQIPNITEILTETDIKTVLEERFYIFHVHEFGSTVIFMAFLENLEPDQAIVDEYSKQGHVFLLPFRAIDLVNLKDNKIRFITYKALDHETGKEWYKIIVKKVKKSGIKKLFGK